MTGFSEAGATARAAPDPSTAGGRTELVSFDLYERYSIVSRVIRTLRNNSSCSVLDIGGHSELLWPGFESLAAAFLPEVDSFVIDLHREPGLTNYAVASGTELPFVDGSFDFVIAQDTLEHIPLDARPKFLREALRVSRDFVLLSFPFFSALNEACDRFVYRFIQLRKNVDLTALKEHLEFGLPDLDSVREWITETGLPFHIWTHGNALVWLNMMMAKNHLWTQGVPELGQELDAVFNLHFAGGDYQEPCYRAFVLIGKERAPSEILEAWKGPRSQPLSAADQDAVYSLCRMITASVSSVETERRVQHSINLMEQLGQRVAAGKEDDHQWLLDRNVRLDDASAQVRHLRNLLDEQQQRRVDAETHLAEAASQAAHYKNLLDEQQEQRADAETHLAEAASQAAHYKNLLDEQQQRRADAETHLAEATSQAAHYKNLLDEQQQRRADAETHLAEATSQAAHYKNLLDEQQQRRADAETHLAEAASQAAHYKNLLDEQQQRRADAEIRFAEAASQAAHYKNLLDEQQQRRADAEIRFAEAASQAAHYRNLLDEQQQRRADAETRLAEAASQAAHYKNLLEQERQRAENSERGLLERSSQLDDANRKLAQTENRLEASVAEASGIEAQLQTVREGLKRAEQELAQEQLARATAEAEARSLNAKLSRFPTRLFVR